MRIGICSCPESAAYVRELGYDYIELSLAAVAAMGEKEYADCRDCLTALGLPCEAMNCMLPGGLRLTGPEADPAEAEAYLDLALPRAQGLGVRVIVFGSGAARRAPEGTPLEEALAQVERFARMAGERARRLGLELAIEPLNAGETNLIHTVDEGAALARRASVGVLADLYHVAAEEPDCSGIVRAGALLRHAHIANPQGRGYPAPGDGADYAAFFAALRQAGYGGRVSVEGLTEDFARDAARALPVLRDLAEA